MEHILDFPHELIAELKKEIHGDWNCILTDGGYSEEQGIWWRKQKVKSLNYVADKSRNLFIEGRAAGAVIMKGSANQLLSEWELFPLIQTRPCSAPQALVDGALIVREEWIGTLGMYTGRSESFALSRLSACINGQYLCGMQYDAIPLEFKPGDALIRGWEVIAVSD